MTRRGNAAHRVPLVFLTPQMSYFVYKAIYFRDKTAFGLSRSRQRLLPLLLVLIWSLMHGVYIEVVSLTPIGSALKQVFKDKE